MILKQRFQKNEKMINQKDFQIQTKVYCRKLMSLTENDPLRFLKPRKKQFHLTPTKPQAKQSSSTQYDSTHLRNQSFVQKHAIRQNSLARQLKATQQPIKQTQAQFKDQSFMRDSKTQYNPLKYFSQVVEDFLTNKARPQISSDLPQPKFSNPSPVNDRYKHFDSKDLQTEIIPKSTNSLKKFSQDEPSIKEHQIVPNKIQTSKPKTQSYARDTISSKQTVEQPNLEEYKTAQSVEQYEQNQDEGQTLKRCEICSRSFNPNSYEKHVKICEKVFFKKRKEFSSEKQRSLSKKK